MTEKNSTFRGAFTARSFYITSIAAIALAVACALFFVPGGNTTVQASSNDDNSFTSQENNVVVMSRIMNLNSSARYGLWAKGNINDDGSSTVSGDVGSFGGKLTGLRADQVRGTIFDGDSNSKLSSGFMKDIDLALDAFTQAPCTTVDAVDLGGKTFGPGTYCLASARLAGQMTLDGHGDPNAMFLFRVLGPVATKDGASIQFANGAQAGNAAFFSETSVEIGGNSLFRASVLSRGDITIGSGSTVGKVITTGSVSSENALMGAQETGQIEICKFELAGTTGLAGRYFEFFVPGAPDSGFGADRVRVPVGGCSGPITLAAGTVTVTETGATAVGGAPGGPLVFQNFIIDNVASNPAGRVAQLNNRAFNALVVANSVETLINVTNRPAITGVVEICKYPTNPTTDPITGTWLFTIDRTGNFQYSVPVNQCSGPIFVTIPVGDAGDTSGTVTVTEFARNNFINTGANTVPAGNFINFIPNATISPDGTGTGGRAVVRVDELGGNGGINETIVNFFNATTPGTLKICKIANPGVAQNPGIPLGTRFDFTVSGLQGPLPGAANTQTVRVAAGPAAQGGFCTFATGTFIVGSNITITEVLPPVDPVPGVPPGQIIVTNIQSTVGFVGSPNFGTRTAVVRASDVNRTIVTFTNTVFRPTLLKVCKIAGPGIAVGTPYTFDLTLIDPNNYYDNLLGTRTVTVSAGPNNSQFGNCVFVNGPSTFPTIGAPPFNTWNIGMDVRIDERVPAGQDVVAFGWVGSLIGFNGTAGILDLRLTDPTVNMGIFVNRVTPTVLGSVRADFDGNGTSDLAAYGPSNGSWNIISRFQYSAQTATFGQPGDVLVPGDYDGDKKTDYAVYRNGQWLVQGSAGGSISANWGLSTDKPVAADYDGDGKTDIAVYRPSNGNWFILRSSGGYDVSVWGNSTDLTVPGDYDADGKADIAVYRPSTGTWFIALASGGAYSAPWGVVGDKPVQADYDGDGKVDIAIYRPSDGNWYLTKSAGGGYDVIRWGNPTDVPSPGDYDGDGKYDITMYRPSDGNWYILGTRDGMMVDNWGNSNSITIESMYIP